MVQVGPSGAVLVTRETSAGRGASARCGRCGNQNCCPVWQMSLHLDDGSAECKATVEGDSLFDMFSSHGSSSTGAAPHSERNAQIAEVKSICTYVERAVYYTGTIRAYVGKVRVEEISSLDYESEEGENDAPFHVALSRVPIQPDLLPEANSRVKSTKYSSAPPEPTLQTMHDALSKCQGEMCKLARYIRKSAIYEFTVKQIPNHSHGAFNDTKTRFSNASERVAVKKHIRVQKISANWAVENVDVNSAFPAKVSVEILNTKLLEEEDLHSLSWEIANELNF